MTPVLGAVVLVSAICCAIAARRVQRRGALAADGRAPVLAAWSLLTLALVLLAGVLAVRVPAVATPAFTPLAGVAVVLLHRPLPRWVPGHWWDAAVVLLGSFSVVTAVLLAVPSGAAVHSDLPAPLWLAALACLALAGAAVGPHRSRPVVWWVAGGLLTVSVGAALQRSSAATPRFDLPEAVAAVGFAVIGVGALRGSAPEPTAHVSGERRRPVGALPPPRALSWTCGCAAVLVVGGRLAGIPVAPAGALIAWAAIVVLLARGAVTVVRGPGDIRTDRLTGLASREAISEALAADTTDEPDTGWTGPTERVALLLADIDRFDAINVALGREAGDAVLTEVGARFQRVLRPPQLLARLGGDEFAVLLPGAGPEPATRVATALREALTVPLELPGGRLSIQAAVGVATCVLPRGRPEDLLRQADAAVHRAKATGSGIAVYDPEKDGAGPGRLSRVEELRSALEHGELVVHLQPQVELAGGRIVGCEALARWRHPDDGVLLPEAFLPLAASTGLLRPVAAAVLDRALEACTSWWSRHQVVVSVNLTADDLLDPALTDRITGALDRVGLPPEALRIELVEEALVGDPEAAAGLLRRWQRLGIGVALDDFGTGYSSLAYLRDLSFDELKLDRVFGGDVRRRRTAMIVGHTVAMAHALGLRVVAEGVEDAASARALADLGCDVGQGLLFGPAMTPADFVARLELSR